MEVPLRLLPFALLLATGCHSGQLVQGKRAPDFSLLDVNSTSTTYDEDVSPRDEVGRVSAWYFGHAK